MKHLLRTMVILALMMTAISAQAGKKGDINGDGNVNTGDVSTLYQAILAGSTSSTYDVNGDGVVNTGDVSALYSLILNPQEYDNEEQWFASCYETLQSKYVLDNYGIDMSLTSFVRQLFNLNELPTDEVKCAWGDDGLYELNTATFDHNIPQATGMWLRLCQNINQCNGYLNSSANHDPQYDAEIRFLRDLYLYYFMDLFGNPPFTTDGDMFTNAPQLTRSQAYTFLVNDLGSLVNYLAEPRTNAYGRVDKAAAWLLLARLHMNAEIYTGSSSYGIAKFWAQKVISSSYGLQTTAVGKYTPYQTLFMGDNNVNGAQKEIILPVQYSSDDDPTFGYSGTTFIVASTFDYDMYTAYPNGINQTWAGNRSPDSFIYNFGYTMVQGNPAEYAAGVGDNRALFYNVDRESYISDLTRFTEGFGYGKFISVKAKNPSAAVTQFADTDFPLMRAAEAYLIYAEADAMQNDLVCTADGLAKLNAVRSRAGATTLQSADAQEIFAEWSREFGYESRRRTDLVRAHAFGMVDEQNMAVETWAWKGDASQGGAIDKVKNIYGIPTIALEMNPNLHQNPGYDVQFPALTLNVNQYTITSDDVLNLDWTRLNGGNYYCYPTTYQVQVSFSTSFNEEVNYQWTDYATGRYTVITSTPYNRATVTIETFKDIIKWYESTHGGSISDDHYIYFRVVGNGAGIGKATSNMISIRVTGLEAAAEDNIWWLVGDCIADGSWSNVSKPAGSSSMIPMLPNGKANELVYEGYFPDGGNFLILSPEAVGTWSGRMVRGGNENGGQVITTDGSVNNIIVNNSGYYRITLNTATNTVKWEMMSPPMDYSSIGIPGYHNGWDTSATLMTPLSSGAHNHDWVASLTLTDSPYEFKFAANGWWDYNWGSADFPFGVGVYNGQNIVGQRGTWYVYFNDMLGTYGVFAR